MAMTYGIVMAGLVPAIHVSHSNKKVVDARDKRGHDTGSAITSYFVFPPATSMIMRVSR
jgi:hypothetical protein